MPSHYTKKEWAIREERRSKKKIQSEQLDLFSKNLQKSYPETKRIIELNGHHWLCRSFVTHEEHIIID